MVVGTIVLKFDLEEIVGKSGISVDATTKKTFYLGYTSKITKSVMKTCHFNPQFLIN